MRRKIQLAAWGAFVEGTHALREGQPREAARRLREALVDPRLPEARHNLALAMRGHGAAQSAFLEAHLACEALPDRAEPRALLGSLHQLRGDRAAATRSYLMALEVNPSHRVSWALLAFTRWLEGHHDEAARALDEALAPDAAWSETLRARLEGQRHDLSRARLVRTSEPAPDDLCSVPMFSEIFTPEGILGRVAPTGVSLSSPVGGDAGRLRVLGPREVAARLEGRRLVALTGAGISSASGLATRKALWKRYSRDDAVSIWRFHEAPIHLWETIDAFLPEDVAAPNPAHSALAALEPEMIITQNIDSLHGEPSALELHGSFRRVRCHACGHVVTDDNRPLSARDVLTRRDALGWPPRCPRPGCEGALRPDVVLFGEPVDPGVYQRALDAVRACDVLLVVGCAMDVAPASELPRIAAHCGATIIECKRNPSRITQALGAFLLRGLAEETLPEVAAARKK